MINASVFNPKSIVVIGASNDTKKPGGKLLKNILDGKYSGNLYVINPKEEKVQGVIAYQNIESLPTVELAILAIPAKYCKNTIETLTKHKETKAFIIISAGFGETDENGQLLEKEIVETVNKANACLIGPNCIGVLTPTYNGVFTTPIPPLDAKGCDLISASGATAVFIMEAGIPLGLKFANVISVGNGSQTTVEDVLEYMDLNYDNEKDSNIKLLYLETIKNPNKLFKHAYSLITKGAKIAAIKSGTTDAGMRAAASHTGAIASSDVIVRALFKKAGIVYCSGREELLSVASIFNYKELCGKNIGIITHAGGSAVMLTDILTQKGLNVPHIEGEAANKLLSYLYPGSSVANPIDFLATGTAEQLSIIIDYCEHKFKEIDAMVVVFGSPGLFDVENVYNVLSVKLDICEKPIYPVLPSVINAQKEIQSFIKKGHVNFPDEVTLGKALAEVYKTQKPNNHLVKPIKINETKIRAIIDNAKSGFLSQNEVLSILECAEIPFVSETLITNENELNDYFQQNNHAVAMKVDGLIHKTDSGGVVLNVSSISEAKIHFKTLMQIKNASGVIIQPMVSGIELFVGVKKEVGFNHAIVCGLGGIYIEVLKDFSTRLLPLFKNDAKDMIQELKGYKLLNGYRNTEGIDLSSFENIIEKIGNLINIAPEIEEMDINPLMGKGKNIFAVDTRIKLNKEKS